MMTARDHLRKAEERVSPDGTIWGTDFMTAHAVLAIAKHLIEGEEEPPEPERYEIWRAGAKAPSSFNPREGFGSVEEAEQFVRSNPAAWAYDTVKIRRRSDDQLVKVFKMGGVLRTPKPARKPEPPAGFWVIEHSRGGNTVHGPYKSLEAAEQAFEDRGLSRRDWRIAHYGEVDRG